jgi:NAD(P)-dependent dehydrogenase (short-subunit alcohol dehydrogenase family)
MKHQIAAMRERGGVIVNNASTAGMVGLSGATVYGAAKAGVIGMTRAAAVECARDKIRVNAVAPAAVATEMIDRLFGYNEEALAGYVATLPIGRIAQPEELADAVVWLCSDRAAFVTGQTIAVDGGYTAK